MRGESSDVKSMRMADPQAQGLRMVRVGFLVVAEGWELSKLYNRLDVMAKSSPLRLFGSKLENSDRKSMSLWTQIPDVCVGFGFLEATSAIEFP